MSSGDFDPERHIVERRWALPVAVCWFVVLPLLVVATLRLVAHDATFELVALNAITPWLYLPAWCALALGLFVRKTRLSMAAGSIVIAHVVWLDPRVLLRAEHPAPASNARLRVMSANVLMVNRDTEGISREILEANPDLLLVQELSPTWEARFQRDDFIRLLPNRYAISRTDSFGIGIYSRAPLQVDERDLFGLPALRAEVAIRDRTLTVLAVHTLPPRTRQYAEHWNQMMQTVSDWVRAENGPLLLAGDLNATRDTLWYRRLLALGLRGAHEECGRGFATTWPNGLFPFPPIRLDHFLVSNAVDVLAVREGQGQGSDHRPIVGEFEVR